MTAPVLTGTGTAFVTTTTKAPHRGDERIPTCVEIGYDSPWTFGLPNGQWIDVTSDVRALTTNRGRQAELQRFEAGTLTLKLNNLSGNYSRWVGSGLDIGCPIRVRLSAHQSDPTGATPTAAQYDPVDGGFFPVFYGFIEKIDYDYSPGGDDAWVTITAADSLKLLSRAEFDAAVFTTGGTAASFDPRDLPFITGMSLQYGHDRLVQVVDQSGVKSLLPGLYVRYDSSAYSNGFGSGSAPRSPVVDSGAPNPVSGSALSHVQDIAEAAFVDFYARPDGLIAWRPYSEVRDQTFDGTTIFGDNIPTEIPYDAVAPTYDDDVLFNDAAITFADATVSATTDAASILARGRRALQKSVPVYPTMVDGATLGFASSQYANATFYVTRYKDPLVRIPSISTSLRAMTDAQRARVLSLPIGYRVQVKRRATGGTLTAECHFEGISLTWEPGMKNVKAVLSLAPTRAPGAYSGL